MYQILVDGEVLYDPREEELIVNNPKCKMAVNTIGELSFSVFANHPLYNNIEKLKSVFEVKQDGIPIFRGRATTDTKDFDNIKAVDVEGAMGYFNDSIVHPFAFPDNWQYDEGFNRAMDEGRNIVEYFLGWLIQKHNSTVVEAQKGMPYDSKKEFKLGKVTVSDPNNYISRSSSEYLTTWEILKTKLFESSLGGYLCIRYEEDGNYIDYLADFEDTNSQVIEYGENLVDLSSEADASEVYTAIIPLGKKIGDIDSETWYANHPYQQPTKENSKAEIYESNLSLDYGWLEQSANATADIARYKNVVYSKSGVEKYGWIYAPPSETTWEDVSICQNLLNKGVEYLKNTALKLTNTISIKAIDLNYSDDEIAAFKIYQKVKVKSTAHDYEGEFVLSELEIDLQNPQNTNIVLGDTKLSMTDINAGTKKDVDAAKVEIHANMQKFTESEEAFLESCEELFVSKIEQFAKKITLEIDGSLGSKASVVLSVYGQQKTGELDLSKVREAFANDDTSVEISAGVVQFNAGTIIINSNNFKVSSEGVIEATSGTIGAITLSTTGIYSNNSSYSSSFAGWYRPTTITTTANCFFAGATNQLGANAKFLVTYGGQLKATDAVISGEVTTIYSSYKAKLDGGGLELYFNDVLCGTVNTKYWSGASTEGISLRVEEGGNYIMFSHADDTQGSGYTVDYYLNAGWSSNYDEMHIFQTSARFLDDVYFAGYTRIRSLRLFGANGEYLVGINSSGQLTVSKL
jgi:hypothetical protein